MVLMLLFLLEGFWQPEILQMPCLSFEKRQDPKMLGPTHILVCAAKIVEHANPYVSSLIILAVHIYV